MSFRFGRTDIVCSYPLIVIMTAVLLIDTSMNVFLCFLAALMHEAGHLLALRHFHTPPDCIRLSLFDIAIIDRRQSLHSASQSAVIAAAGVAVNFMTAFLTWLLFLFTGWIPLLTFIAAHLTLGIFNALPVHSLDGGQVLMMLLSRHLSPVSADRILTVVSVIVLIPLACLGFLILFSTRYNFTLLLVSLYLTAVLISR